MASNYFWKIAFFASLTIAAPLWGTNTISMSCPTNPVPAGGKVTCPVTLTLDNAVSVDSLSFAVGVNPNGAAPALSTGHVTFPGAPLTQPTGANVVSVSWLNLDPPFTGTTVLGNATFNLPSGASGGQTYDVALSNQSASVNGVLVPLSAGADGTVTVLAPLVLPATTLPGATMGKSYSQQLTATGGLGPYTWSAPALSGTGLTISGTGLTGTISGTPTATQTGLSVVVTVTDSNTPASSVNQTYTLVVNAVPAISNPSTLPSGVVGTAYSQAFTATGGTAPLKWTATGLSGTGLSIDQNSGTISGTPTSAQTSLPVTVTVTDANQVSSPTKNYTLNVTGPLTINGGTTLTTGTVTVAYSNTIVASGGTPGYTWSATNLPPGLSIGASTGTISGTPTTAGSYTGIQITVTDSATPTHASVTINTYTMTVDAQLKITTTSLGTGTSNATYNFTLAATGGNNSYTWSQTGLPSTLTLNTSTGKITGTPTATFNGNVVVTVTDGLGVTANATLPLVINQGLGINGTPGAATVNTPYTTSLTAVGGTPNFTWQATNLAGTGLAIAGTGATGSPATISGTPTSATPISTAVTLTDANNATTTANYTITVNALPTVSGTLLPATVGAVYTSGTNVAVSGGTSPFTWTKPSNLPAGLNFNTTSGQITGTPTGTFTTPQTVTLTIALADANGATASHDFSLTVDPALSVTTTTLPAATKNAPFAPAQQMAATGGNGTYSWTASNLPTGLNLSTAGVFSGTPTGTTTSVTFTVTDGNGVTATKTLTLTVNGALTITGPTSPLPGATKGRVYTQTIATSGGTAPFAWTTAGTVPAGLGLNASSGVFSGTPTTAGSAVSFTATVTDANNATASVTYSITVADVPSITTAGPLGPATIGWPYTSTTIAASNGTAPLAWSATGLPTGMSIGQTTGTIGGTPTATTGNPVSVVVTVTDANGATGTQTYSLVVNPQLTITGPATLPVGTPNVVYPATTVAATGGFGTYVWSATGLPSPLVINSSTGVISGTPTNNTGSPYAVTVTVTDGNQVKATKSYTLAINPPLSISGPASIPAGTVNVAYPATAITASGGSGGYSWGATGLPSGLTIDKNSGTIAGAPTTLTGSPFTVTVTVTDSSGSTASKAYSLTVTAVPLSFTVFVLPPGVVNIPYAADLSAKGGIGDYKFSATGLPAGLSVSNASITGTPTTSTGSPFSVVLTVTDSNGTAVSSTIPLTIGGTLTIALPATLPAGAVGSVYPPTTLLAGGGKSPYVWSATGLPAGMSIGPGNGILTGTPTAAGSSTVTVTVLDQTSHTATKTYTLTINPTLSVSGPSSLPTGTVGAAYTSTTVTATGGSGTYTWAATGLATGLTINSSTGAISGTPTSNTGSPFLVVVTVTDSNGATATMNYSLTVNPVSGLPVITSVSNAAGGQAEVSPSTYAAVYGTNFATPGFTDDWTTYVKTNGKLPTLLEGVSVSIGGQAAYIYYLSATQINVFVGNVGLGPVQVTVTTPGGTSAAYTTIANQFSPAMFLWPGGQPVATHSDYSLAAKNGTFPGTTTIPAKPGETIVLWGTGFGPTVPSAPLGVALPAGGPYLTANQISAAVNGAPVPVYGGIGALAPGFAGLFQFGITVPQNLPNGDYTVTATVNGVTTPAVSLSVHN